MGFHFRKNILSYCINDFNWYCTNINNLLKAPEVRGGGKWQYNTFMENCFLILVLQWGGHPYNWQWLPSFYKSISKMSIKEREAAQKCELFFPCSQFPLYFRCGKDHVLPALAFLHLFPATCTCLSQTCLPMSPSRWSSTGHKRFWVQGSVC